MDDTDLRRELREIRERLDDWPTRSCISEGAYPKVKIEKDPPKLDYKLKPGKFPIYNGDRVTYPAWRTALLSTLKRDWNTFRYDNSYVFLSIYNALEGKAKRQAGAFFESGGRDGRQDPEEFIAFLDRISWDPNKINRARSELSELKMGSKQQWASFFSQWANKLTEANGDRWPDDVKINQLKVKLNFNLRKALANNHLLPNDDYHEWLRIVGQIAQQHEELGRESFVSGYVGRKVNNYLENPAVDDIRERGSENLTREWSVSGKEKGFVGDVDSGGDTFMGGVNLAKVIRGPNGKPLRAKWKSQDQIKRLKEEGRCFRCERKGCSTKVCRILPAINPTTEKSKITVSSIEPLNLELFEEIGDHDENSGKCEIVSEN